VRAIVFLAPTENLNQCQ